MIDDAFVSRQEADNLRQQLTESRQELDDCHDTIEALKIQLAQLDAKSEQGNYNNNNNNNNIKTKKP